MKKIIYNENNNSKEEIIKVKIIIKNKDKILLAYCNHKYLFIGGHLEPNETLLECLNREITEETGMELNIKETEPFLVTERYYQEEISKKCITYYYEIETSLTPNQEKIELTEREKRGNFCLVTIEQKEFIKTVEENYKEYVEATQVGTEIIDAYKTLY